MSSYHRCTKCASDQMIDGAYLSDANGVRMVVGVDEHPDRGPLPRAVSTGVHACVCGACGYVEFYANRPGELWSAYAAAGQGAHR